MNHKSRYIMIGGFLGAGKTTAVIELAKHLQQQGVTTGLITNDQSTGLVDTALVRKNGFNVEEIPGGCFCCKFNSLVDAAKKLSEAELPDVFIAEPVGSCTDLVATVSYPLRRMYGDQYVISPLSVLIDPIRAGRILGIQPGPKFSEKVVYVYNKQLEEADYIIINKSDITDAETIRQLREELHKRFSPKDVFVCSSRNGDGLQPWFDCILNEEINEHRTMDVDYELYAEGEALLGWLNATVSLNATEEYDGNAFLELLAQTFQSQLNENQKEIAHLKMTLVPNEGFGDIASINLVRNDFTPELSERLDEPVQKAQLIINMRAESVSTLLQEIMQQSLHHSCSQKQVEFIIDHVEHFQPAKPEPVHRIVNAE